MSTTNIFKLSLLGFAGLSMTACASSGSADRYGDVYDYEGVNGTCGQMSCMADAGATVQNSSRYGDAVVVDQGYTTVPVYQAPVQQQVVYQPAPVYQAPVQQTQSYTSYGSTSTVSQMPAECPAGTTAQSDGTCMQSGSTSSYSSYSAPSSSYSAPVMSEPANCPAGTTAQSDGTCMQGSTSSYSSYSSTTPSYSSGTSVEMFDSSSMSMPTDCPAGTTAQSDGTCMQGSSSVTTSAGGYTTDGYRSNTTYLPIRK